MKYALVSDAMDPATGDALLNDSRQGPRRGNPTVEQVIRRLRTPRGQCPLDPKFGVDMSFVDKAHPDLAARWRAAVTESLQPLIDLGLVADIVVTVDNDGSFLLYEVQFFDVRERMRTSLNLEVRA